jgi:hypothetical protein
MSNKLTNDDFIEKSNKIHNNKYNYSLTDYKGYHTKIKIICPIHGEFKQRPSNHLNGQGCPICGVINSHKTQSFNKETFVKKASKIHNNKYDYSLVEYVNCFTKIKIICPTHGEFKQRPNNHIRGDQCPKCGIVTVTKKQSYDNNIFIKKAIGVHGDKYDYSLVDYVLSKIKIKIKCPKHGVFLQKPSDHLYGKGCPHCRTSKGEIMVKNFLEEKNIKYISQHSFPECRYKRVLKFDFYLPNHNMCIEYDGKQHFTEKNPFGDCDIKKRDEIKNQYCIDNSIGLIRIKYSENVGDKLKQLIT